MSERRRTSNRTGPRTHIRRDREAWSVHVIRGGKLYTGHFADAVWGGTRPARIAAQRYRDELLQRIEPDTRVRRRVPRGVRSETGVVGVTFERYSVKGREYERYVASWQDEHGRKRRRRFGVGQYGKRLVFKLACRAREEGVSKAHIAQLSPQREEAARRLEASPPMPRQVKDPRSRKGISMKRRRPTGRVTRPRA